MEKQRIYGLTGEVGRDGLLTPEQTNILNQLQEKAAVSCINYLDQMNGCEEYPLVAMATGFGKGNIIHRVIEKQVRKKPDSKVLLIAGTKLVLVRQTHEALSGYQQQTIYTDASNGNGFDYIGSEEDDEEVQETTTIDSSDNPLEDETSFLYTTGKIRQKDVNVHVATIQTVQSEMQKGSLHPEDYDLVIVDEVHNIGTDKRKTAIQQFKKAVGFTATPVRYTGRMKAPEQYGFKVIESLTLPEAQELRLLPPLIGIQIDTTSVLEDNIPTTLTGLIDYKKLEKLLKDTPNLRPYIADRLANIIKQDGANYKTVVAVNFVWEAQELAELLKAKGIKVGIAVNQQAARALDSEEIPALDSIERYKLPESNDKSLQVLISPYILGEGFDAPATEVLVWASPTDSYLRYTQYTGRLARRWEGKRFGVIVDCLYQTSQYNWSYNMGMWMKGYVQQLDNGLLYLGPETDIENLKRMPQAEGFQKESSKKALEEIQTEGLLEVQETDFPITVHGFESVFIGGWIKLKLIAQQIIDEKIKNNPDAIAVRRNGVQLITVATDRDWFIKAMQKKGVSVVLDTPQNTEFPITGSSLSSLFTGTENMLRSKAEKIAERLAREHPWLIINRQARGGQIIKVSTDRDLFIKAMLDDGVRLKSQEVRVQQSDFVVTNATLRNIFLRDDPLLTSLAKRILSGMKSTHPDWVVYKRDQNSKFVPILPNKEAQELFIKRMLQEGARLKNNELEPIKPTDFAVINTELISVFINGQQFAPIAKKVLQELKKEDQSLIADRIRVRKDGKNGKTVQVVTDRDRFIQEMVKRGVKLKPPK